MPLKRISPLREAWYKWKALRLPWRTRFLIGKSTFTPRHLELYSLTSRLQLLNPSPPQAPAAQTEKPQTSLTLTFPGRDLQGNTFWEFKDSRSSTPDEAIRWRRIVRYPRSTHYSDVAVSPLWHQWLRHTRANPPSLAEQSADELRREQMRVLAARADARWAAKPKVMDVPAASRAGSPALESRSAQDVSVEEEGGRPVAEQKGDTDQAGSGTDGARRGGGAQRSKTLRADPWERARGPSENWQPEAWSPKPKR